jgi:hypothetical protein
MPIDWVLVKTASTSSEASAFSPSTIDPNIRLVAEGLTAQSSVVKEYVDRGTLKFVKGKYHLRCGHVTLLK